MIQFLGFIFYGQPHQVEIVHDITIESINRCACVFIQLSINVCIEHCLEDLVYVCDETQILNFLALFSCTRMSF